MKNFANQRGIAITYVTLFLLVLGLLFVALGIDVGWMAFVRNQAQTTVDAAALAAAAGIPEYNNGDGAGRIYELAQNVGNSNNVMNTSPDVQPTNIELCSGDPNGPYGDPSGWTCTAGAPAPPIGGVRVTRTFAAPLFLAGLISGQRQATITVSATAWLGSPAGGQPELPVTVCRQEIYENSSSGPRTCKPNYSVDFNPNNRDNGAYWNFDPATPTNPPNPTSSQCRDWVKNPEKIPYIALDQPIGLNNGSITSCLQDIERDYGKCTEAICNGPDGPEKERCTVIVPVVDCPNNINQQEPAKEFAAICVTGVKANPASGAYIKGKLKCNVPMPGGGGGIPSGVNATRPVLVR